MKPNPFLLKNARREAARLANRRDYQQGRENRRLYAKDGAFGHLINTPLWDRCALGTSARPS